MNSSGAYCASVATFRVPFVLIAAGTVAAIDAFALVALLDVDVAAELDEDEELLLLPHPASTTRTSAAAPSAARSFLIWNPPTWFEIVRPGVRKPASIGVKAVPMQPAARVCGRAAPARSSAERCP